MRQFILGALAIVGIVIVSVAAGVFIGFQLSEQTVDTTAIEEELKGELKKLRKQQRLDLRREFDGNIFAR